MSEHKSESNPAVLLERLVRPPETKTDQYWMLRKFAAGKWVCDTGQFWDRQEVEDFIAKHPATEPGVEKVPVRITETIVSEYDAA